MDKREQVYKELTEHLTSAPPHNPGIIVDQRYRDVVSDIMSGELWAVADFILAREGKIRDEWIDEVKRYGNELARLRSALELIATPKRPDGTYNRDREACRQLALEALQGGNDGQ